MRISDWSSDVCSSDLRMRQSMQETLGSMFPFGNLEEVGKQNMVLFENALRMFSPFGAPDARGGEGQPGAARPAQGQPAAGAESGAKESLDAPQAPIAPLQRQPDPLNNETA